MRHRPWTAVCAALALATAGAAEAATVAVHGTVSQGYLRSSEYNYLTPDTRQGTFAFNEGIINFSGQIDGRTRVGLQFLGRDFGPVGNGEVIVDWAFGDYRWRDSLGFRVGKAAPVGLFVETFGTETVDPHRIEKAVSGVFDLRPGAIVRDLDLLHTKYAPTAGMMRVWPQSDGWLTANATC